VSSLIHDRSKAVVVPILEVDGVRKTFGPVRAVRSFSLAVAPGELVALVGPNGAGKTTLLRMIMGILRPDEGRVVYGLDGVASERVDPTRIGYLPEDRGLYVDVPVRRVLLYFAALRGMRRSDAAAEADRWLERLGLAERANEEVRALSKGNQQKVQFLSSVLHRPSLAVLDEPFSGLDPLNQDLFLTLIRELREAGTTVLFSAHQMQLVERLADRVVLMRAGEAADHGTVAELRERWGTGRRLRLRFAGEPDLDAIRATPGIRDVQRTADGAVELALAGNGALNAVLRAISRLDVVDLQTEAVTLHDIYVRTVGGERGEDRGTEPVGGEGRAS
jgi:ABC-2 type transport system ATP-binding protein